jgi:hypothetical protein
LMFDLTDPPPGVGPMGKAMLAPNSDDGSKGKGAKIWMP